MDFVDDVDFFGAGDGCDLDLFTQVTDVFDAVVTGSVDFDDVKMGRISSYGSWLISCAKIRAIDVLPTPRGPVKR